ncbi:unnamed protein product [Knipowitschia caucasica]
MRTHGPEQREAQRRCTQGVSVQKNKTAFAPSEGEGSRDAEHGTTGRKLAVTFHVRSERLRRRSLRLGPFTPAWNSSAWMITSSVTRRRFHCGDRGSCASIVFSAVSEPQVAVTTLQRWYSSIFDVVLMAKHASS